MYVTQNLTFQYIFLPFLNDDHSISDKGELFCIHNNLQLEDFCKIYTKGKEKQNYFI